MLKLADAIRRTKAMYGNQTAFSLAQQLGIDQNTYLFITQTTAALREQYQAQARNTQNIDAAVKSAQEAQKSVVALRQAYSAFSDMLSVKVAPALTKFFQAFTNADSASHGALHNFFQGLRDAKNTYFGEPTDAERATWKQTSSGKVSYPANQSTPANKRASRGLRNNNPGNIKYGKWAVSHGAVGRDGPFAVFPDMATGQAAMSALLNGYYAGGKQTISGIVSKWAPGSENNTAGYIASVSKQTGIGANDHLTRAQLAMVQRAMTIQENGYAGVVGAHANTQVARAGNSIAETHIGTINVQTQATDANGIAGSMRRALVNNQLVSAATVGSN